MIDSFSPQSRRIIAVGLLVLKLFAIISFVLIPTTEWVSSHLNQLADSRLKLARMSALANMPPVQSYISSPESLLIKASNKADAQQLFNAHLRKIAELNGLQDIVIEADPEVKIEGLLQSKLKISAAESQIAALISQMESNQPLIRFAAWNIRRESAEMVVFESSATAGWQI